MHNTTPIQSKRTNPLIILGTAVDQTGNIVVPPTSNLMRIWACCGGGGGGGGYASTSGGGGGGGSGTAGVISLEVPVVPGETLTYQVGAWGKGGGAGFAGTDANSTFIIRGVDYIVRPGRGRGGSAGTAASGGNGGGGASDLYLTGGTGSANANGGSVTITSIPANWAMSCLALPFFCGLPGCGGTYSATTTSYTGGSGSTLFPSGYYTSGGSTSGVAGGGGGGAGGTGWPGIYPHVNTGISGTGGADGVAGTSATYYGMGGGGGGRNAAGGDGGPAFLSVAFI